MKCKVCSLVVVLTDLEGLYTYLFKKNKKIVSDMHISYMLASNDPSTYKKKKKKK